VYKGRGDPSQTLQFEYLVRLVRLSTILLCMYRCMSDSGTFTCTYRQIRFLPRCQKYLLSQLQKACPRCPKGVVLDVETSANAPQFLHLIVSEVQNLRPLPSCQVGSFLSIFCLHFSTFSSSLRQSLSTPSHSSLRDRYTFLCVSISRVSSHYVDRTYIRLPLRRLCACAICSSSRLTGPFLQ